MKAFVVFVGLLLPFFTQAQDSIPEKHRLSHFLSEGDFSVQARYFWMATHNQGSLSDYYAHAVGAGLGYTTPAFKGFRAGMSGYFLYNLASSDFTQPDPATGAINRYEIGLFDLLHPASRRDLKRLEELFLQYQFRKSTIRYGRFILNTPFINPQDGRMRPTTEGGIWTEVTEIKNTRLQAGWLYEISPRSTMEYVGIGESIGIYPSGLSISGKPAQYKDNLQSAGIGLLGLTTTSHGTSVQFWDVMVQNLFNTALLQLEQTYVLNPAKEQLMLGGQLILQNGLGNGGNDDPQKAYFPKGGKSAVMSFRLGYQTSRLNTNINYTRIGGQGRYLMPREWGKDPFYTFLPRERNDGFGDVHAFSLNAAYLFPKAHLRVALGVGQYQLPDVKNYSLNKYSQPSYRQYNLDLKYTCPGYLEGMEFRLLYAYKEGIGNHYDNPRNIINKVNMGNFNFVVNYRFAWKQQPGKSS